MEGQPVSSGEQLKADIIARQNAEVEKLLNANFPSGGKAHPVYAAEKLSLLGFICVMLAALIVPYLLVFIILSFPYGPVLYLGLIYIIGTILFAIWSLFHLKAADHTSPLLIGLFSFCLVTPLSVVANFFVGIFGGLVAFVVTACLVYIVLNHYDWLEH